MSDWVDRGVLEFHEGWLRLRPEADTHIPDGPHTLWGHRANSVAPDVASLATLELGAMLGSPIAIDMWSQAARAEQLPQPQELLEKLVHQGLGVIEPGGTHLRLAHRLFQESVVRRASTCWAGARRSEQRSHQRSRPRTGSAASARASTAGIGT